MSAEFPVLSGSKKRKPTRNTVHKLDTTSISPGTDNKKLASSENIDSENFDTNNDSIMEETSEKNDQILDPVLANLISNPANLYPFLFQSANNTQPTSKQTKSVASPTSINLNNNSFFGEDFQKEDVDEVFFY